MNTDSLEARWTQLREQAKQRWSDLTDDDLDKANGKLDELAGLLREKYDYTIEKAHEEIGNFLKEHDKPVEPATPTDEGPTTPKHEAEGENWQTRSMTVNTDVLAGKWMQLRGQAKQRWGDLTDDDLDKASGKADELAGLLREKYGYTTERAQEEIDNFLKEHEGK